MRAAAVRQSTNPGTLIMSAVLNFLSLRGYFGSYDDAVFGAILIAIMLFAPDGIMGFKLREIVTNRTQGQKKKAL